VIDEIDKNGDHASLASVFNQNEARVDWHDETLWFVRQKRDRAVHQVADWEDLRSLASQIKENVLDNLHDYLIAFEQRALENGIKVHWAATASEHNKIVYDIIKQKGVKKIVKSKSMLTEECHLNEYLESNNIEVIDTDLGERIVQLAKEPPSHIVLPCIHKKKEEIGELFSQYLGTPKGNADAPFLTAAARAHLRQHFMQSTIALTGVNFAIAETGEIVVCTNEGNADLGTQLADVHIACMGIEKIIPQRKHLGIFLRLLARSATGQPITTYSSHFLKPRQGQETHIVLVDNGRSQRLKSDEFRNALKCIRCGACINTCPVYRRSGGHSYHHAIAGPIGAILAPGLDMNKYADLPFASTLCGSCTNVCPVKIDIHDQLYKWRQVLVRNGHASTAKAVGIKSMAAILSRPLLFKSVGRISRMLLKRFSFLAQGRYNPWHRQREMPAVPPQSFKEWYLQHGKKRK
jgi:L-lactate dehydrogenase complex protein LldF